MEGKEFPKTSPRWPHYPFPEAKRTHARTTLVNPENPFLPLTQPLYNKESLDRGKSTYIWPFMRVCMYTFPHSEVEKRPTRVSTYLSRPGDLVLPRGYWAKSPGPCFQQQREGGSTSPAFSSLFSPRLCCCCCCCYIAAARSNPCVYVLYARGPKSKVAPALLVSLCLARCTTLQALLSALSVARGVSELFSSAGLRVLLFFLGLSSSVFPVRLGLCWEVGGFHCGFGAFCSSWLSC